ncbi:TPA: ATP/GTP-binding protein, partial [Vibrio vulnificus]
TLSVLNGKVIEESLYCRKNEKNQHNKMIFNRSANKVEISPDYSTHEALLSTVTNTRLIINVLSGLSIDVIDQYITWCSKNILIEPRVINYEGLLEKLLDQAHDEVYNDYEQTRQFHKNIEDYANKYLHCFGINVEKVNISFNNENKTTISVIPKTLADEKIRLTISEAKDFYSTGSFNLITLFILLGIVHYWTGVILFDEIDSTFHHKLSKEIINIISSDDNNSPQLILTTHDILLLDNDFRRDSIYTITKGEHLKSHIDRVSKYSIRKDAKLSLKYLSDEFGALPRILENYCD